MDIVQPNEGRPVDVDLGDGHTLTWTYIDGVHVGGIIRHNADTPTGYCESHFWFRGVEMAVREKRSQWDMTGTFECPTLSPSFLCHCQKDHGWIREGKWVRA